MFMYFNQTSRDNSLGDRKVLSDLGDLDSFF